jgi:hypothetical protein
MLALRYAALLMLVIWVGGLLALGAIAAPAIFDGWRRSPTRDGCWRARCSARSSGGFTGQLHRGDSWARCCWAGAGRAAPLRLARGPRHADVGREAYMTGRHRADREAAEGHAWRRQLPEGDARRVEFGRLRDVHCASTLAAPGGLMLIYWEIKE